MTTVRNAPPRWAVRAAHLITVLVLPSGLWRVGVGLGFSMGIDAPAGFVPGWDPVPLALTAVSEGIALLSLGLVRPWGEVFPRWIPLVGGRPVPPVTATTVAAVGAVALTAIWSFATVSFVVRTVLGPSGQGFVFVNGWWEALLIACYLPLLLWGPLLLAITGAYYRRRRPVRGGPGLPRRDQVVDEAGRRVGTAGRVERHAELR